jgi:hypothetical protein
MANWTATVINSFLDQTSFAQKALSDRALYSLCYGMINYANWSVISGSAAGGGLTTDPYVIFDNGTALSVGTTTRAATGTNHSWILLKSPNNFREWVGRDGTALSSSLYMLIDCNNTTTFVNNILFSYEAPATTGTTATAPSWENSSSYWGYDVNQADELVHTHTGGATGDYVSTYMSPSTTTVTTVQHFFGYRDDFKGFWFVGVGSTAVAAGASNPEYNTPQPRWGVIVTNLDGASSDDVAPIVTFFGNMNTFSTTTINQLINDTAVANGGVSTMNNNAGGTVIQSLLRGISQDGTTPVFNLMTTPFLYNAADLTSKSLILAANFTENAANRTNSNVSIYPIPVYTHTNGYKGIRGYLPNFYHCIRETIAASDTVYVTTAVQVFGSELGISDSTKVANAEGRANLNAGNLVFPGI